MIDLKIGNTACDSVNIAGRQKVDYRKVCIYTMKGLLLILQYHTMRTLDLKNYACIFL